MRSRNGAQGKAGHAASISWPPWGKLLQAGGPGPLCRCVAQLRGCCGWGEAGAAGRGGMRRRAGTRNPAEQAGGLEELVPNVMCQCCLSRFGVCPVSRLPVGRKGLGGVPASAGQGRELWQRGAGRRANGQQVLTGPPRGKPLITLWAGQSAGCFIEGEVCFLLKCFSPKRCFALRKLFSHQLRLFF